MAATNTTSNYDLPVFLGTDKPSWLVDWNGAMNAIDEALHELSQGQAAGVTKQYVDDKISTVTSAIQAVSKNVETMQAALTALTSRVTAIENNYLSVGGTSDGITATQYEQLKANASE